MIFYESFGAWFGFGFSFCLSEEGGLHKGQLSLRETSGGGSKEVQPVAIHKDREGSTV